MGVEIEGRITWKKLEENGVSVVRLIKKVLRGEGSYKEEQFVSMVVDKEFMKAVAMGMRISETERAVSGDNREAIARGEGNGEEREFVLMSVRGYEGATPIGLDDDGDLTVAGGRGRFDSTFTGKEVREIMGALTRLGWLGGRKLGRAEASMGTDGRIRLTIEVENGQAADS